MTNILLIYTGGTIGMQTNDQSSSLNTVNFDKLTSFIPELKKNNLTIHHASLKKIIDSSNMNPKYWLEIADIIKHNYKKIDGFVILHGTDTMAYSASAMSFILEGLQKPVIFTGSQIPIGARRTDAIENLVTSVEIASSGKIKEVCVYFENKLLRGNRTVKINSEQFEAFISPNYPSLADIGINIKYNLNNLYKSTKTSLKINSSISSDVAILKIFPGISEKVVKSILHSAKNIVLEAFGEGNTTDKPWFMKHLQDAIKKQVFIVNCSQCLIGEVSQGKYEVSAYLNKIGVVSARDMTTESAITKLMFIDDMCSTYEEKKSLFIKSLRGEISN